MSVSGDNSPIMVLSVKQVAHKLKPLRTIQVSSLNPISRGGTVCHYLYGEGDGRIANFCWDAPRDADGNHSQQSR